MKDTRFSSAFKEGWWLFNSAVRSYTSTDLISQNQFQIEPISTSQRRILDSRQRKFNFTTKGPLVVNKQFPNFGANFKLHNEGYWTPDNRRILDSRQRKFNFTTKGPLVVNKQLLNFRANFNFTTKDIGLEITQVQLHDEGTAGCQQTTSQFQSQFQLHNEGYWTPDNVSSTSRRRDRWLSINNFSISEPISNFTTKDIGLQTTQRKFNFTTKGPLVVNKQFPNFGANFNFTTKDIGLQTTQRKFNFTTKGPLVVNKQLLNFRANFNFTTKDIGLQTTQHKFYFTTKGPLVVNKQFSSFRTNFNFTSEDIGLGTILGFQLHDEGYPIPRLNFTTNGSYTIPTSQRRLSLKAYLLLGKRGGSMILLLHDLPELWYSWRHQIVSLSSMGYRDVAPDLRGFGDSDSPDTVASYTCFNIVGDVVELINLVAPDERKVFVVGHDWGAYMAWYLRMFRPGKVKAVVNLSVSFIRLGREINPH
ncbi:Plectin-related isoform 1 [Hibiscus syriacus]|uniref:Plectin-related isoform 1 n=2 Tax=Hibiscus syriacus TaxID=106335 RepID=A0A6A3AZE8_HIBSY|nr:Plectin-related isoform 1 [Hibiscus syriacus]